MADKLDMFELLSLAPSRQHSEVTERLYRELGRKGSRVSRDPDLARAVKRELRSILERLGHDWVKYHHEEALVDAAELCAMSGSKKPRWLTETLVERGLEAVCGIKRKKKRGAHTDFLRNQILFTMVQSRRDADPDHHLGTAVLGAYADMKDQGYSISIPRLEGIYKSHRKLVKRNKWGCWIPRAGVYFPRRSDAFYSVPTVVS